MGWIARLSLKKMKHKTRPQTVKDLYLKSGDLSLVPRTPMVGEKSQLPEVVLLTTHVHKINGLGFFSFLFLLLKKATYSLLHRNIPQEHVHVFIIP